MTPHRWPSLGHVYVAKPVAPSHRKFGLTVGIALGAIAAFSAWRGHMLRAEILAAAGAILVVGALVRPASLAGLSAVWGRIGHALGWVNSRVLLTLMFVFVLCPAGLLSRVFGGDVLDRRRRDGSLWMPYSSRLRDPKHYERLF